MTKNNVFYEMRVIPLMVGKESDNSKHINYVDNLSNEEVANMSSEQRILWEIGNDIYLAEIPLTYRGNGISKKIYYVYDELTQEEQEKYFERSIVINVTKDHVIKVYDDNSKRLFPKRRIKEIKKK